MNKFRLTVDVNNLASQIACLINSGKQIWYYLTDYSIISSPIQFLIELDKEKVIAVIGLEKKNESMTELKYLCVHPDYRRQGLGKKMLELGIKAAPTKYVYGTVRVTNEVNIRNNFRVGMKPIGRYRGRNRCPIIVFARRREDASNSVYESRA